MFFLQFLVQGSNTGIQDLGEKYPYLVNIPYTEIKKILNLFQNNYDIQREYNKNLSIISPKYISTKINEILENLIEGEKQTYSFILKELKMVNIDSLIEVIKFIDENKMSKNFFIRTEDAIIKKRGGNVKDFINDIFTCTGKTKADTRIFQNRTGIKHKDIIKYIKKKIKDKLINETHNLREEAGVDIIMKLPTKNWRIEIQIEATIDIAEIKKEERTSFVTKILSKITDSTQYNLDLFVILFCIDITVDSYYKTLGITISRLEKLLIENFLFIRPENYINFFKEFNESKII